MKTKKDSEKKIKVQTVDDATDEHAEAEADEARKGDQSLEDALEAKTQEAREHYERSLRLAAELDNYKKRAARTGPIRLSMEKKRSFATSCLF